MTSPNIAIVVKFLHVVNGFCAMALSKLVEKRNKIGEFPNAGEDVVVFLNSGVVNVINLVLMMGIGCNYLSLKYHFCLEWRNEIQLLESLSLSL